MPNYKNSKIYCIRSYQTDKIYIGSTTQKLCQRMGHHRKDYREYLKGNKKRITTSIEILKYNDAFIELIINYPCDFKEELLKKEGEYISKLKCINKYNPSDYITDSEIELLKIQKLVMKQRKLQKKLIKDLNFIFSKLIKKTNKIN